MMRSIRTLAARACCYSPPGAGWGQAKFEIWLEDGWRYFVQQAGSVYSETMETKLALGQREFALPADYREMRSCYLGYTPHSISAIARASGVTTVTTGTAHNLATGMTVKIEGVASGGGSPFDGTFPGAAVLSLTAFSYPDAGEDDSGSGGEVRAQSDRRLLQLKRRRDLTLLPEYEATAGTPQYYYFLDPFTIGIDPVSDGGYPALFVEYDAGAPEGCQPETPTGLDLDAALPPPGAFEASLIEYAQLRAKDVPHDQARMTLAGVIRDWRAASSRREARNRP